MTPHSRTLAWRPHAKSADQRARAEPTPRAASVLLALILLVATLLRLYGVPHDLPYSYFHDELVYVNRAMAMGAAGALDPHWYNKPAFLMYLLLAGYGAFFVAGWLLGQFASPEAFGAYFLADQGAFLLIGRLLMVSFGVATVYVTHLLARRAFGPGAALGAAAVAAVLPPMVAGSYIIESDVPAGFFVALAVYLYLGTRDAPGLRPLLLAAAAAGVATGTKYYGLIALPVFGLAELARRVTVGEAWPRVLLRGTLLVAVFVAAFFAVSPYHFLAPTFGERLLIRLHEFFGAEGAVAFDPDSRVEYEPGFGAAPGAALFFFSRVLRWDAIGWPLAVLAALGVAGGLARRESRWATCVVAGPVAVFVFLASTLAAYHIDASHLNAILPLLAVFVFPGAALLVRGLFGLGGRTALGGAAALVLLALAPSAYLTVAQTQAMLRPDSRTVAARWIAANLPRDAMILLDHYGPVLPPNAAAVERLQARLDALSAEASEVGAFDAFTGPEARRLAVLRRHPIEDAFNVDRLNHPWWLPREVSDAELRRKRTQWQMGNPLWSRVPDTLAEYRAAGFRYFVTNSTAQERYREPGAADAFPTWARFYKSVRALEPLKVFDPAAWGGKGPVVWIYDLRRQPSTAGGTRGA